MFGCAVVDISSALIQQKISKLLPQLVNCHLAERHLAVTSVQRHHVDFLDHHQAAVMTTSEQVSRAKGT